MFSNCIERLGHKKNKKTKTKQNSNKQTKKNQGKNKQNKKWE